MILKYQSPIEIPILNSRRGTRHNCDTTSITWDRLYTEADSEIFIGDKDLKSTRWLGSSLN